jgi:hypothetical protein
LAGKDTRDIKTTNRITDVGGINNHTLYGLPIVTATGVVKSQFGKICVIMHQYAHHGKGKTIHSSVQIEHHGSEVNDKSLKVKGGKHASIRLTDMPFYFIYEEVSHTWICIHHLTMNSRIYLMWY